MNNLLQNTLVSDSFKCYHLDVVYIGQVMEFAVNATLLMTPANIFYLQELFILGGSNMAKYVYILLFGMIGACLRYGVKKIVAMNYSGSLPISTFVVNITGSFMLAFFLTLAFEIYTFKPEIRTGVSVGFFGALTTFSTFVKEISIMLSEGKYLLATSYGLLSILLGVFLAYGGILLARKKIMR